MGMPITCPEPSVVGPVEKRKPLGARVTLKVCGESGGALAVSVTVPDPASATRLKRSEIVLPLRNVVVIDGDTVPLEFESSRLDGSDVVRVTGNALADA